MRQRPADLVSQKNPLIHAQTCSEGNEGPEGLRRAASPARHSAAASARLAGPPAVALRCHATVQESSRVSGISRHSTLHANFFLLLANVRNLRNLMK